MRFIGFYLIFLANKAQANITFMQRTTVETNLNLYVLPGFYTLGNSSAYQNGPPETWLFSWAILEVLKVSAGEYIHQRIHTTLTLKTFMRTFDGTTWWPWTTLAINDAAQVWNDPVYSNGYASFPNFPLRYTKDSLGNVTIAGDFYKPSGSPVANENIFTLPAGFRPSQTFTFPVTQSQGFASFVHIPPSGIVIFGGILNTTNYGAIYSMCLFAVFKAIN